MRSVPLLLAATCVLGGCDPQATKEYKGEPMLSLSVSVDLGDAEAKEKLVPALAFRNRKTGRIDIVDVDVRGEFPARFTLDVRGAPPATAFHPYWTNRGEPDLAYAWIAATKADHPESIKSIGFESGLSQSCTQYGCTEANAYCTQGPESGCRGRYPFASDDCETGECYEETLFCPPGASDGGCRIESATGDREIKYGFGETFAGVASNYVVVYAKEAVPANSATAALLHVDQGLPAGYHLFEARFSDPADPDYAECLERVEQVVLVELNTLNNSNHPFIGEFSTDCTGSPEDRPGCFPYELSDEYDSLHWDVDFEMRCAATLEQYTRVEGDLSEMDLSLELTNDLTQFDPPL